MACMPLHAPYPGACTMHGMLDVVRHNVLHGAEYREAAAHALELD